MKLFVSYSRKDMKATESLARGLKAAGHDLWIDRELSGGVEWWNAILARIREADAFVAVVSRAALASVACSREREYAVALARPALPVLVERMPTQLLPPDLAQRQLVDYITPDDNAAFVLLGGIARMPPAPPLPDPVPLPPEAPMSYLSEISRQVYEHTLTRDQQLAIAVRLREAAANEDDYDAARELTILMERRDDLYAVTQRQLQDILALPRPTGSARTPITAIAKPTNPQVGEQFLGTVEKLSTFGVFVSLPGTHGLLHISEMRKLAGGKRIDNVEDVLGVGQKVLVEIRNIDRRGRLSLSPVIEAGATSAREPRIHDE